MACTAPFQVKNLQLYNLSKFSRINSLLYLLVFFLTEGGINLVPLKITLTMIGKFGIASSFGVVFLFAVELYPTTIR